MKKILVSMTLFLFVLTAFVYAEQTVESGNSGVDPTGNMPLETGNSENSAGQGSQLNIASQTQNVGENQQLMNQERIQLSEQGKEDIKAKIQQKQQELTQASVGANAKQQEVLKNQNEVRVAVHALLSMEEYVGGVGPQISAIAKEFDNSVQSTITAEEKIQTKSGFAKFFSGGDEKAAADLEAEVAKNQERLTQLKQLKDQCECDEATKALMQEQILSMEQEQERLKTVAQEAKKSKGLFGWMWK
jgi:hypothetical protein